MRIVQSLTRLPEEGVKHRAILKKRLKDFANELKEFSRREVLCVGVPPFGKVGVGYLPPTCEHIGNMHCFQRIALVFDVAIKVHEAGQIGGN
jgi:hypothetical protein